MRIIRLAWCRFNVILAWPFLLVLDWIVSKTLDTTTFAEQRHLTKHILNGVWTRYSNPTKG